MWFGNLLDWQRDPQTGMYCAWHGGRTHFIIKLTRRDADVHRTYPGWHLWDDDPEGWYGIGPHLGSTLPCAHRMAEAWIVCPYNDLMGPIRLHLAIGMADEDAGRIFGDFTFRTDHEHQQFIVARRRGGVAAYVRPIFLGRSGAVTVRWRAFDSDESLLASAATWNEVLDELQQALTHT